MFPGVVLVRRVRGGTAAGLQAQEQLGSRGLFSHGDLMVRRFGSVLTVACLFLAGFTPVAANAVPTRAAIVPATDRARPSLDVKVDWPDRPGGRQARHRARPAPRLRADHHEAGAAVRVGLGSVVHKSVSARSFVFRVRADTNRYKLRVVLPHVVSRTYAAPQPAPLVRRVDLLGRSGADHGARSAIALSSPVGVTRSSSSRPTAVGRAAAATLPGCRVPPVASSRVAAGVVAAAAHRHLPRRGSALLGSQPLHRRPDRARLVPLDLNAAPVTLHSGKSYADAAVVTVPRTGRVMVRGWTDDDPRTCGTRSATPTGRRLLTYGARCPTSRPESPSPTA